MIDVDAYLEHIGGRPPRPEITCILCRRVSTNEHDILRPCDAPREDGSKCPGIMSGVESRHPYADL